MNEVVQYSNDLNSVTFKNFTAMDINLLMVICAKLHERDTEVVVLTYKELRAITGSTQTSNIEFTKTITRMNRKLLSLQCGIKMGTKVGGFTLFITYLADYEQGLLEVQVHPKFRYLLNNLLGNYTIFELREFISLKSIYTKNLYRILKQFRITGVVKITDIKDFREKLECPEAYANKDFIRKIFKPSIEALEKCFDGLSYELKTDSTIGRPLKSIKITFKQESKNVKIGKYNNDQKQPEDKGAPADNSQERKKKPKPEPEPKSEPEPKPEIPDTDGSQADGESIPANTVQDEEVSRITIIAPENIKEINLFQS